MSASWQYNTSANMGSYGSVTVAMPQPPSSALTGVPGLSVTSNSQYGAWFGSSGGMGTRPSSIPGSGSGSSLSSTRVLGIVPSANNKYSNMKTNTVSGPDPKEKFSNLANKFGAGRILTPITSQYDMIMQEAMEAKPIRKESKTPIHSPDIGQVTSVDIAKIPSVENGYCKVTHNEDGLNYLQKDSFESRYEAQSNVPPKLPVFERSQTLLSMAASQPSQSSSSANLTGHVDPATGKTPFFMTQRANTFIGDTPTSRFGRDIVQKPLYPWRHEPHPPPPAVASSSVPVPASSRAAAATLSLNDIQRAGSEHEHNSAGSQRSALSDESASSPYVDSSQVSNGMYWLYGSRGRQPPANTPFQPSSYMCKTEQRDDSRPNLSAASDSAFPRAPKPPTVSPVSSPRGRSLPPSRSGSDYDSLRSGDALNYSSNPELVSSSKLGYDSTLKINKKSILKKISSYEGSSNYPYYPEINGVGPRFSSGLESGKSYSPVSRGTPGSPVKAIGSNKKVTFTLTPMMKEISPRPESTRDYMNMFTGFRFSSLSGYSKS